MTLSCHSASSIKTFLDCSMHYRASYLEGKKSIANTFGLYGTALHSGIEEAFREDTIPHTVFDTTLNKGLAEFAAKNIRPIGYSKNTMLQKGYDILDTFPFERYDPIDMEYEFFVPFPVINPICSLHGYIDNIDSKRWIIDYKSNSDKSKLLKYYSLQMAIYTYAYVTIKDCVPNRVFMHHLPTHTEVDYDLSRYESDIAKLYTDVQRLNTYSFDNLSVCKSCNLFCPLNAMNKRS